MDEDGRDAGRVDWLEANVARFQSRHPALAARVLSATGADAWVVAGPRGQATVSWRGTLLASAYDPSAEGERLAATHADGDPVQLRVALGFGTGHHLEALLRHAPCRTVVWEPEPARLRAALAARPGQRWLERGDVLLSDDLDEVTAWVSAWYAPGLRLGVVPHPALARLEPDRTREAVARVARQREMVDVRFATLRTWARTWAETTAHNAPFLLSDPSVSLLRGLFAGTPAVVCAAGPSLTRQLPELAAVRDRVLVIAIGQSAAALERHGIRPDLVYVTETQDVSHQLAALTRPGELDVVLAPQSHPSLFELPVGARWLAFQESNPLGRWLGALRGEREWPRTGGTVAVCAVYLAAWLGADPVILIGQDLAFTDGRRYAEGSLYGDLGVEQRSDGTFEFTNLKVKADWFDRETPDREAANVVWVEGWDGRPVPTDRTYASFREEYRVVARKLAAEGVRLLNCTEGGARIPGLEHRPFAEVLAEGPVGPVAAAERLRAAREVSEPADPDALAEPLAALRRELAALRRDARRGLERSKAPGTLRRRRAMGRWDGPLAGVEERVRNGMARLPLLETLIQGELQELIASARGAEAAADPASAAVARLRKLLRATVKGVDETRALLERLEARLAEKRTPAV